MADSTAPGRVHAATSYAALKNSVRRACEASGPLDAVAPLIGLSKAHLSRAYTIGEDTQITLDRVLDLDTLAGGPVITSVLARLLGFRLVVAEPMPPQNTTVGHLVNVHRSTSEVVQALSEALADGKITKLEMRQIEKETSEAIADLEALRSSLVAQALGEE